MNFQFRSFDELGQIIARMTEEEKKSPVRIPLKGDEEIFVLGTVEFPSEDFVVMSGDRIHAGEPYLW